MTDKTDICCESRLDFDFTVSVPCLIRIPHAKSLSDATHFLVVMSKCVSRMTVPDRLVSPFRHIASRHNRLVSPFRRIASRHHRLVSPFRHTASRHNRLVSPFRGITSRHNTLLSLALRLES